MGVLTGLKPEKVFEYFETISRIPRGSGNTRAVTDYLLKFAEEHHLRAERDDADNVIIWKSASPGFEDADTVILQGHSDMVCEKTPESDHDFRKDPLELEVKGDFISARGTTLGGDDGIAVAYILAVLDDDALPHPPLEALITADEEIGLVGAFALDCSRLKGRVMLNLDSETEGVITAGSAGGSVSEVRIPVKYKQVKAAWYMVRIHGLLGGHSGSEIHKGHANSNLLAGRILNALSDKVKIYVSELAGGNKNNAIPRETRIVFGMKEEDEALMYSVIDRVEKNLLAEYRGVEDRIQLSVTKLGVGERPALKKKSFLRVSAFLNSVPNGVIRMSGEVSGLVQTSCNPGIMKLQSEILYCCISERSALMSARNALNRRIRSLAEGLGGTSTESGFYPAWEYEKRSPFRDQVIAVYEKVCGKKPKVEVIHAGLECGLFYHEMPGLQCVSMGPDIFDIHTFEEHMSVSSVQRMWAFITAFLKESNRRYR